MCGSEEKLDPEPPDVFSGNSKDPEDYIQWKTNINHWLRFNDIPDEKKLTFAVKALSGDAYQWWLWASTPGFYNKPISDWGELKGRMYTEFVQKYQNRNNFKAKPQYQATHSRVMSTTKPQSIMREISSKAREGKEWNQSGAEEAPQLINVEAKAEQGEPPDMPNLTKLQAYRGKTLNSQKRMKVNLLSIGAGHTVSRSKLFQEGEYDEDIKPPTTQEHEEVTKNLGENQSKQAKDIGVFLGAYRADHEELSYKTTCPRILTHQGITDNLIHFKPDSELKVIEVTSWQTGFRVPSAIGPKIELHSPTYSQSRPQTTWRMLMDLLWFQKAQEANKQPTEAQVITQSTEHVYLVPFKGNSRPDRFSNIQTYLWRPGETLNQSGESYIILPYTSIHRIRRILSPSILPYPGVFTFCVITLQRLGLCCICNLSVDRVNQDVPRHNIFMPKLSRYKESRAYLE